KLSLATALGVVAALTSVRAHAAETAIRVSSLGFRPSSRKTATVLRSGQLTVRRADDDVAVYSAPPTRAVADSASGQTVYVADFTAVQTPGDYYLELQTCERSPVFRVAADVYVDAYKTMMLGFYGQRCGTAVALAAENASFAHGVCHAGGVDLQYFDGAG